MEINLLIETPSLLSVASKFPPEIFILPSLTPNDKLSPNFKLLSLKYKCLILYSADPRSNAAFSVGIKFELKFKLLFELLVPKVPLILKLLSDASKELFLSEFFVT